MTFSRQLILLLLSVVVLLLVVSLSISFYNTRIFVENQLSSHAQDGATSLGMSASTAMREGDQTMVRSLVDAMFHSGDYQRVSVFNIDGEEALKRRTDVKVEGIPEWFIKLVPLSLPVGESIVMDGWVQAGRIQVASHPGYAYRKLWDAMIDTFKWFLISAFVVLAISLLLMRKVLQPLKLVEQQANAISEREFMIVEKLPATRELNRIVRAMNHLAGKVSRMLSDSEALAQKLREQAKRDSVTGLANRQHFMEILNHRIDSAELMEQGVLLLVQLKDFKQFNDQFGFTAGDELLKKTGQILQNCLAGDDKSHLAHLAGASFAILLEDADCSGAKKLAQKTTAALTGMAGQMDLQSLDVGHVGAAVFEGGQNASELLSMADAALREAQTESANGWAIYASSVQQETRTASQWREYLSTALEQDWLVLQRQAVFSTADKSTLHEEVYVRLAENGNKKQLLSAGSFMPMAQNLGLATAIDRRVVEKALGLLQLELEGRLAVNLSPQSLDDQSFLDWLEKILAQNRDVLKRLILEFPEYGVVKKLGQLQVFHDRMKKYGIALSLDHFGRGFTSFAYLQKLRIDIIKIDGSYIQDLENSSENQFFVQALAEIAHGLEIQVVAESVETEQTWSYLSQLKVDGGQGYYLAEPS